MFDCECFTWAIATQEDADAILAGKHHPSCKQRSIERLKEIAKSLSKSKDETTLKFASELLSILKEIE